MREPHKLESRILGPGVASSTWSKPHCLPPALVSPLAKGAQLSGCSMQGDADDKSAKSRPCSQAWGSCHSAVRPPSDISGTPGSKSPSVTLSQICLACRVLLEIDLESVAKTVKSSLRKTPELWLVLKTSSHLAAQWRLAES